MNTEPDIVIEAANELARTTGKLILSLHDSNSIVAAAKEAGLALRKYYEARGIKIMATRTGTECAK